MFDKIINLVKAHIAIKKVGIFFLAFAVTLTVMGGNYDRVYGSSEQAEQEFAGDLLLAVKEAQPKDATSTTAKKDGVIVKSNIEDEEDADSEANAGEGKDDLKKAPAKSKTSTVNEDEKSGKDTAKKTEATGKKTTGDEKKTTDDKEKTEDEEELSGFVYSAEIPMSLELQKYTYAKCMEREIEYELVLAIIWRESRFNVNAVHVNSNGTRDNGIMQINDVNRQWLKEHHGITDLMNPYQNIDAGTAMLGRLTSKYGSHNAMLAYQYGEGGMARRLKQGITTSPAIEKAYKQREYYRKIV